MYWLSTKSPKALDRHINDEVVQYLTDNIGVDPYMLAKDLHIKETLIRKYQRRLGLRRAPYSD